MRIKQNTIFKPIPELERDILKATRDVLRLNGWKVWRNQQGLGSTRGRCDLEALRNGATIFIECKTARGILSKFQERESEDIRKRGGEYIVIRSADHAVTMFNGR